MNTTVKESKEKEELFDKIIIRIWGIMFPDKPFVTYLRKKENEKYAFPDTEADGYTFCGKCGKMK